MGYTRHIEVSIDMDMGEKYDGAGRVVASTLEGRVDKAVQAFVEAMGAVGEKAESVRYRTTYGYRTYSKVKRLTDGVVRSVTARKVAR